LNRVVSSKDKCSQALLFLLEAPECGLAPGAERVEGSIVIASNTAAAVRMLFIIIFGVVISVVVYNFGANITFYFETSKKKRENLNRKLRTTVPFVRSNRSETISTAGWPKGIYVVKATIGKDVLTEKVMVKYYSTICLDLSQALGLSFICG